MKPSPFKAFPNRSGITPLVAGGTVSAKAFNNMASQVDRARSVRSSGMKSREFQGGTISEHYDRRPETTHPFQVIFIQKVPAGTKKRDESGASSPHIGKLEFYLEEGFVYGPLGMTSQSEGNEGGENSWSSVDNTMGDFFNRPQFARKQVVDPLKKIKYLKGLSADFNSDDYLDNRNFAHFYMPDVPGKYYFVLRYNRAGYDESGRVVAPFECWAVDWETRAEFVTRGEMEIWTRFGSQVVATTVIYRLPIAVVTVSPPPEGENDPPEGVEVRQLLRSDVFWPKSSLDIDSDGNPSDDSDGSEEEPPPPPPEEG